MGKNWKGGRGGGGRGGGGKSGNGDMTSCRGCKCIMATCDPAREREASKELVNLLNQAIEKLIGSDDNINDNNDIDTSNMSLQEQLSAEISEVKGQNHQSTQQIMSINTDIKGIILVKLKNHILCPIKLITEIFDRASKDRQPISRHIARLFPFERVFFPNEEQLKWNLYELLQERFPNGNFPYVPERPKAEKVALLKEENTSTKEDVTITNEDVSKNDEIITNKEVVYKNVINDDIEVVDKKRNIDVIEDENISKKLCTENPLIIQEVTKVPFTFYAPFIYNVMFKARNHSVLNRLSTLSLCNKVMPKFAKVNYKEPEVINWHILSNSHVYIYILIALFSWAEFDLRINEFTPN
jgi:hypothetical protein